MSKLLLFFFCMVSSLGFTDNIPLADVQTQILAARPIATVINCFGVMRTPTTAISHVTSSEPGSISELMVQKGMHVLKGQKLLVLRLDPTVIQLWVQAQNQLVLARQDLAQQQQLAEAQLGTKNNVIQAEHNVHDAELAIRTLKSLGADHADLVMTSPQNGVVSQVMVHEGDHVDAHAMLVSIGAEHKMDAVLQVDPEDAARLVNGMNVRFGDVFSSVQNGLGKISLIGHNIDPQTRKVEILVSIKQSPVLEGMALRARITVSTQNLLAVPRAAVLQDNEGSFVYRISMGHAHRVAVNVGHEDDGWVAVSGDLSPGQHIVVLGNYELQDGMAVREELLP